MQRSRSTMLSSSEARHLGSSSSSNQVIIDLSEDDDDHDLLPDALESAHYVLNSHDVGGLPSGQQSTGLSLWDSAGSSSSMGFLGGHESLLQVKMERLAAAPSLSIGGGGPLIIDRVRRREGSSSSVSLPSSHLNIDLNLNQPDQQVDAFPLSNGQAGTNAFPRGFSPAGHVIRREIPPSGTIRNTGNLFDDTAGQEAGGSSVNHFRSSAKRKNIAGGLAESSASGSSRNQRSSNTSTLLPSPSSPEGADSLHMPTSTNYGGFQYPPVDTSADANFTGSYTLSDHLHENERFLRNTRMRRSATDYDESLPNLLPEGSSFRCSARQPAARQPSSFTPVQPRAAMSSSASSSHNRPHLPSVAQLSHDNFGSRMGTSSDTINLRSAAQDPGRGLTRTNLATEPFLLGPSMFTADSASLLSAPGSRSNQQNSSSTSTLRAAAAAADVPQPSSAAAPEMASRRHSLAASALEHSAFAREIRSQQHYSRAVPPSLERQSPAGHLDLQSFMQTIAASREGSRTVSELRSVFEQLRQGRSAARLEEFLADRSLRRGGLIDRHREMRLDVDNMSYEELLALGDRIGHVSTGLSEEKVMSGLKQWKYLDIPLEEKPSSPATGVEPCCICQEEYGDGEEMGRVECGHYFHAACIKQWLVIKNTCPICKKPALAT